MVGSNRQRREAPGDNLEDKEADTEAAEFWCGTCTGPPEDDDVVIMDEIDLSQDPGELPAPWSWVRTAVRKVRTFGQR